MTDVALRRMVLTALFMALVVVATMVINIPMVGTQGFVNVGDTIVFLSGYFMGPWVGLVAGGLGSALADLLLGYPHWAPWTLVIKGLEGLLVGSLAHRAFKGRRPLGVGTVVALLLAALWMVSGYYIAGGFMYGFPAALASVPGNIAQGIGSILLAWPAIYALSKTKFFSE